MEFLGNLVGYTEHCAEHQVVLPEGDFLRTTLGDEREVGKELLETQEFTGFFLAGGGVFGSAQYALLVELACRLHGVLAVFRGLRYPFVNGLVVSLRPAGELVVLKDLVAAGGGLEHVVEAARIGVEPCCHGIVECDVHLVAGSAVHHQGALIHHTENEGRREAVALLDLFQTAEGVIAL